MTGCESLPRVGMITPRGEWQGIVFLKAEMGLIFIQSAPILTLTKCYILDTNTLRGPIKVFVNGQLGRKRGYQMGQK